VTADHSRHVPRIEEQRMQPTASTTGVRDTLQVAGKTVARMAFGAMRLADCRIWGPPTDRAHSIRLARRAVECGVEHIDAADTYGLGVVEDILREALHPYPEHLLIATKIGQVQPRPGEWVPVGNVAAATLRLTDRQVAMLTAAASANAFTASDN
jgi:aryl-alcohol dehydrogenase-like predicted oxidoreductase